MYLITFCYSQVNNKLQQKVSWLRIDKVRAESEWKSKGIDYSFNRHIRLVLHATFLTTSMEPGQLFDIVQVSVATLYLTHYLCISGLASSGTLILKLCST